MTLRATIAVLTLGWACCASALTKDEAWRVIAPSFDVPKEYEGKLGAYRSPLVFDDGSRVTDAAAWPRRRAEILEKWHGVMGPWPKPLANPQISVIDSTDEDGYVRHRVKVQAAAFQWLDGYLLVPKGEGRFPAVVVPFYDPETSVGMNPKSVLRDFALQLTRRGFVTLSVGSPGGDARKPDLGGAQCQPLSYLGYVAANLAGALAQRPDVDPKRLGIVGHSYGGKWAMFGSCLCERYAAACWSDPGIVFDDTRSNINYWEPWYLGLDRALPQQRKPGLPAANDPLTGPYRLMRERGMDLVEFHALMAPRPVLISGGAEDPRERWVPLNHLVEVDRVLGVSGRVGMHNRPAHPPTAESNEVVYAFFEYFLK